MSQPIQLTLSQKLHALHDRFYLRVPWVPVGGDYYTTSRNDLELYQIIRMEGGMFYTRYCDPARGEQISEWPAATFTTEGFGVHRVWVAPWVISNE